MAIRDPHRNFKFEVEIDGFVRAGFKMVTGLKQTTEVIEYREGGENSTPRKLPGQTTFDNVTLERGVSDDVDFPAWAAASYNATAVGGVGQVPDEALRREVTIYLKNKAGLRVKKWTVKQAWVTEYETDDLDASGNDVLINRIVLTNEGVIAAPA